MNAGRKVTKIQYKNTNQVSIFLDDEFGFDLSAAVLVKSGIASGDILSPEQVDKILELEEIKRAKDKAMRLLAVRSRTKKEIIARLRKSKFSQRSIEFVIEELERLQLLNDAEFAQLYVRSRMAARPVAANMLRLELKRKGVNEESVENSILEAFKDSSEEKVALLIAQKIKKQLKQADDVKKKKRVVDLLKRRGFTWDTVNDVLKQWQEF
jgi:regulatory protein